MLYQQKTQARGERAKASKHNEDTSEGGVYMIGSQESSGEFGDHERFVYFSNGSESNVTEILFGYVLVDSCPTDPLFTAVLSDVHSGPVRNGERNSRAELKGDQLYLP